MKKSLKFTKIINTFNLASISSVFVISSSCSNKINDISSSVYKNEQNFNSIDEKNQVLHITKKADFFNFDLNDPSKTYSNINYYTEGNASPYIKIKKSLQAFKKYWKIDKNETPGTINILNKYDGPDITINAVNDEIIIKKYSKNKPQEVDNYVDVFGDRILINKKVCDFGVDKKIKTSEYGFKILAYENDILIPYYIFNTLFLSPNYINLYYDGRKYQLFQKIVNFDNKEFVNFFNFAFPGIPPFKGIREDSYNSLKFLMNNYYGLNKYYEYTSWDAMLDKYKEAMLNINPDNYTRSYFNFFNNLNDLHSNIITPSLFNYHIKYHEQSNKRKLYTKLDIELKNKRSMLLENSTQNTNFFGYLRNNLFISFDEFAENINVKGQNIQLKKLFLSSILNLEKNKDINNVIIDLSTNGGGDLSIMLWIAKLLSKDKEISFYNYNDLNESLMKSTISNTKFNSEYLGENFTKAKNILKSKQIVLLVSNNTFSAANLLTSIVKDFNLGLIIGTKTGGGMASIMPTVLADGTSVAISSNNLFLNKNRTQIEDGIEPDIKLSYEDFYNFRKIEKIINNFHNNEII
ncbi:S41 family peptidase [Mycoplasma zalophidermidis]|uniref:S41 family peptidase n=1 Tax=Mycoplasma zalophidermidis TaxID=398174 RepID=UPI00215C77B0|nr:S41 family peptidase [Mycoplasma zalophidermidis]MCR8966461.1 S41 family peptidase [Mycoplasma zalophidermidis]